MTYVRKIVTSSLECLVLLPAAIPTEVPQWQKTYIAPYLIVSVLLLSNAVLQKSKKSSPFVAYFDKLKVFHGTAPVDWPSTTTFRSKTSPLLNVLLPLSTSQLRTSNRHSCRPTVHQQNETFNSRVTNQQVRD